VIYLFNSAVKTTYLENVYRLLGLPVHVRADMRYTEHVNAPPIEADKATLGQDCVVCYVDRFAGNYLYLPFRKGKVRSIKREHKRVYYSVELLEHCTARSPSEFTKTIQRAVPSAPRLTDEPTNSNDGIYCVAGPDPTGMINVEDDSWSKSVDQIYQTKSFLTEAPALFLVTIGRNGSVPSGSAQGLKLIANTEYEISVYYRYPFERSDGCTRRVTLRMGTELNRELTVGSPSDRLQVPMTLPPLDFSAGAIVVGTHVESKGSGGGELQYSATVPFRTTAWQSNLLLFGLLFAISWCGEFLKVDWDLRSTQAWGNTFFEFLKFAIVVWAVFKYRGKLKLPGL
jgi:hypothetical protein